MPSKSRKQHNYMQMCASSRGRKHARGKCPPKQVAKEFVKADRKAGKFKAKKKK